MSPSGAVSCAATHPQKMRACGSSRHGVWPQRLMFSFRGSQFNLQCWPSRQQYGAFPPSFTHVQPQEFQWGCLGSARLEGWGCHAIASANIGPCRSLVTLQLSSRIGEQVCKGRTQPEPVNIRSHRALWKSRELVPGIHHCPGGPDSAKKVSSSCITLDQQ